MITLGIRIYALGALALALVGLAWDDFALQWQPVPAGLPGRAALAYLFAAALAAAAVATGARRAAGAAALCGLFALVVLLHAPEVATHPLAVGAWSGLAEQLALCSAGLLAWALLAAPDRGAARAFAIGRYAFGACLLAFGLAHFFYLDFTAGMVPRWLPPGQTFWAVATGVAHLAAGVGILTQRRARLAAVLLTVMCAGFGILIHAPLLLADPHSHLNWVMNGMNLALTGSAWVMADALAALRPALTAAVAASR
ncbi:MAG TPA: DoxX family membrane protein [Steroidobacteraceae bacterium]|nr:DoxX family membrane protein [Steroidobacteraceae bacterium]